MLRYRSAVNTFANFFERFFETLGYPAFSRGVRGHNDESARRPGEGATGANVPTILESSAQRRLRDRAREVCDDEREHHASADGPRLDATREAPGDDEKAEQPR